MSEIYNYTYGMRAYEVAPEVIEKRSIVGQTHCMECMSIFATLISDIYYCILYERQNFSLTLMISARILSSKTSYDFS